MPNGKHGDHPYSDMIIHGAHPFPADIEQMMRKLREVDKGFINHFGWEPFEWEKGNKLDEARAKLKALIEKHGIALE